MDSKKIAISLLAIISILIAIYGFWSWREKGAAQPVRQGAEIR